MTAKPRQLKPRKTFADIDAARPRYNPSAEGYGGPRQWRGNFYERMGWEEAVRVLDRQEQTPREILAIAADSTWPQIQSAFRRRAMECHPDRAAITGMTVDAATEAFQAIGAAYAVLAREFGK